MKILIAYTSRHGFTHNSVLYLKSKLLGNIELANICDNPKIDVNNFDWIVLGGPVYMGKMDNKLKLFSQQNQDILLTKKLALFVSCTTPDSAEQYIKDCFPEDIYSTSLYRYNFGGDLNPSELGLFERIITNLVSRLEPKTIGMLNNNIDSLAQKISTYNIHD
ncbi:hypothetical protein AOC36_03785 [Erysipelothrix larvae]|uniref:Flavodoxin domain-containing protein n=1 Tax=Erysipelothrix larvae TaxID=1514105 RepID=A0A109UGU0_9FIRM|nr:flavodoxin domain-containing protein [Erysipelothrix larvae]AMC93123.1 hypothetical protein AOC36_03785 [Erysipelothrix larvae]